MKKRLGIIGFDEVAKQHYNELRRSEKFDVVGIFSYDESDTFYKAKFYYDLDEFLFTQKPEILLITQGVKHSDIFTKCTKICKFIIFSTPIAKNMAMINEIKYCCKSDNVTAMVGFFQRFNQVIISLKKAILKESKIFNLNIISIFNSDFKMQNICLENIDLVKFLTGSDILHSSKFETNFSDKKQPQSLSYQLKTKNEILANLQFLQGGAIDRHIVEVACESGVYVADLLNLKLYKYTQTGQQNLKVDCDISMLKIAYEQIYTIYCSGVFNDIATLDDAQKAQEIF